MEKEMEKLSPPALPSPTSASQVNGFPSFRRFYSLATSSPSVGMIFFSCSVRVSPALVNLAFGNFSATRPIMDIFAINTRFVFS